MPDLKLIAVAILFSVIFHGLIRRIWIAVLLTAFSTAVIIELIVNWRLLSSEGYIDPYTPIAAVVIAFWASIISFVIGLLFYLWRKKMVKKEPAE
jgi:hypothetical protein